MAAVLIVAAAALFVVIYSATGSELRSEIDGDLRTDVVQMTQAMEAHNGDTPHEIVTAADSYVRAQPYPATARLLFVQVPGEPTASNHPEIFGGRRPEMGETSAEQSLENRRGSGLLSAGPGYSVRSAPDVGEVRILKSTLDLGGVRTMVGAAEQLAPVGRAQRSVARAFVLAGAGVVLIALVASYLAGARVSAPLRRMAEVAARVDAGELAPRMQTREGAGDEVSVLAESFNRMLERLEEAFASQREFIADASHELRTPLTVIRGQLEVLAAQSDPSPQEIEHVERLVGAEIERMSRLVDDMLLLARAERPDSMRPEPVDVPSFVDELWEGISHTADRNFERGLVPEGTLVADPDRLAGALRNLARNAIEHTEPAGLVRLDVERIGADSLRFSVTDDGPGIPAEERDRVFERFHRTDSARTRAKGGAGLGLAIVSAVAQSHGGQARVVDAPNGHGAKVQVVLPGFEPAAR